MRGTPESRLARQLRLAGWTELAGFAVTLARQGSAEPRVYHAHGDAIEIRRCAGELAAYVDSELVATERAIVQHRPPLRRGCPASVIDGGGQVRLTVRLAAGLASEIGRAARRQGVSRSDAIRAAVELYLRVKA